MVSKTQLRKALNQIKKLYEKGTIKKSDFVTWLKKKGIDISTRTPWPKILDTLYKEKISVEELYEFIEIYEKNEEEYEREIIIRERGKKTSQKSSKALAKRKRFERDTVKSSEIIGLIWKLYPGDPNTALQNIRYILDELGIKYGASADITSLIDSLSSRSKKELYVKLKRLADWKEFQTFAYNWVMTNIDLASKIKSNGGTILQEQYIRGISGVQYRIDIYGEAIKRGFFGSTFYLLIGEVKKYSDPVPLEDIMVFRSKIIDILSRLKYIPDEYEFIFMSYSDYSERAKNYAKYWPIIAYIDDDTFIAPMKLYKYYNKSFKLVVKSNINR